MKEYAVTVVIEKKNCRKLLSDEHKPVSGINPRCFLIDMIDIISLAIKILGHIPSSRKINITRWYIWHYNVSREFQK